MNDIKITFTSTDIRKLSNRNETTYTELDKAIRHYKKRKAAIYKMVIIQDGNAMTLTSRSKIEAQVDEYIKFLKENKQ